MMTAVAWIVAFTVITAVALRRVTWHLDRWQRTVDRAAIAQHQTTGFADSDTLLCAPRARALLGDRLRDIVVGLTAVVIGLILLTARSPLAAIVTLFFVTLSWAASAVSAVLQLRSTTGDGDVVDRAPQRFVDAALADREAFDRFGVIAPLSRQLERVSLSAGRRGRAGERRSAAIAALVEVCAGAAIVVPAAIIAPNDTVALVLACAVAWSSTIAGPALGSASTVAAEHLRLCTRTVRGARTGAVTATDEPTTVTIDDPATRIGQTVRSVVRGQCRLTDEQVWAALNDCGLEEPLRALPLGLGSPLAAVRSRLGIESTSRLAVAEALARSPDIAVFAPQIGLLQADMELLRSRRITVMHDPVSQFAEEIR